MLIKEATVTSNSINMYSPLSIKFNWCLLVFLTKIPRIKSPHPQLLNYQTKLFTSQKKKNYLFRNSGAYFFRKKSFG